jgi:thioredoxin reductase (NADPH)
MSHNSCDKLYDLIIIGAGPGGVASAIEAKLAGINKFMVVEKADNHNDMIRKFYKPGKRVDKDWQGKKFEFIGNVTFEECSKEEYLAQMDEKIKENKIEGRFYYNHHVYSVKKICDDVFAVATNHELGAILTKNVIISIGRMGKPNKPAYKFPGTIRPRLNFNLDKVQPGEKVLIVGGGDTAGEYAYGLVDMNIGCDVTLNYRRDKITRMNPTNKDMVEKYINEGKIHSKLGVDIESVEPVENDDVTPPRVKANYKDSTSEIFDRVVYALGGTSPVDFLKNSGIKLNEWGEPHYTPETMETNIKGLYTIGDVVTSAGSIALAFNHAHLALKDIAKKL